MPRTIAEWIRYLEENQSAVEASVRLSARLAGIEPERCVAEGHAVLQAYVSRLREGMLRPEEFGSQGTRLMARILDETKRACAEAAAR